MLKLATMTLLSLIALSSIPTHAQTQDSDSDPSLTAPYDESDEMSIFARRRPRPLPVYRCCAKAPAGVMNCSQDTDQVSAWADAIINCEEKYGKGNCVSGCRKL